tara:strand:+ start:114 stop:1292 length:1179 start_codon:yes stop_codon:yes gene_type:complete
MSFVSNGVSMETLNVWAKVLTQCNNPLGLTEETRVDSLEVCPPKEYKGAEFIERVLVPRSFLRYNPEEQPRDKNNDQDHVNNLINNYEVSGYLLECPPPIACFDYENNSDCHLKGQSGYNRNEALDRIGQDCYFIDIYRYDSTYWEVVARNKSNHHSNPSLAQKWTDYVKEVCNAVDSGIITSKSDSIDEFVDLIASDKTTKVRRKIKDTCYNNCQVFPNFRTYSSTGSAKAKHSLKGFLKANGLPAAGIEGRTDEELIEQGYIIYCAGNGGNKATWMRAIVHGTRLDIPVWVLGYAPTRKEDLYEFRSDYIEEFNEIKSYTVQFSNNVVNEGEESSVDEDNFCVKLAGFLAQYVKPNPTNQGRPTEEGIVDLYGNKVRFDPDGECLTLSQP